MLYRLLCMCLVGVLCAVLPVSVDAAGVTTFNKFISADYWTSVNPNGDNVILDAKGVEAFNSKVRAASRTVVDLTKYPSVVSGDSVKTKIMNYLVLEDDLYLHGNKVSENYKNILRKQTNVSAVPQNVKVQYAVTVRRSNLRNLPTGEGLYYYAADRDFDALQETALDPAEPVVVLHFSANGYFYYVQAGNYSGWLSKYDIAFTDKKTWLEYAKPKSFLVVTGKNTVLKTGAEMISYQQGAKLPISAVQSDTYAVNAPMRGKDSKLIKTKVLVKKTNPDVHLGYLPYTSNNIIKAAFKFYGMPYGWGGLKNSVDCSSLVYNAYRTVGIYLPRNADEQEASAGVHHNLTTMSSQQRSDLIKKLMPGACLYMDGHTVMYVGQSGTVPYVIHSLGSYYNGGTRHAAMKVVVSDLSLQRSSGKTFLNDLTTAVEYK